MQNNHELLDWQILTSGDVSSVEFQENVSGLAFGRALPLSEAKFTVSACSSTVRIDAKLTKSHRPFGKSASELKSLKDLADASSEMFYVVLEKKLKGLEVKVKGIHASLPFRIEDSAICVEFHNNAIHHIIAFANTKKKVTLEGKLEALGELILGLDVKGNRAVLKLSLTDENFETLIDIIENSNAP